MSSTLGRLFNYAKATGSSPVENFTTEALAAAIREDSAPLRAALQSCGITIGPEPVRVHTQVVVPEGQLDLVAHVGEIELNFEVKVEAGESGDQLQRYVERAKSSGARLIVLSRSPVLGWSGAWLQWQDIWTAVRRSEDVSVYWRDFATWLEELKMADDSFEPIGKGDPFAVHGTYRLIQKAANILAPVGLALRALRPGEAWPSTSDEARRYISARFIEGNEIAIGLPAAKHAGLAIGIVEEEDDDGVPARWAAAWIWADPRKLDARSVLGGVCPAGWERDPHPWIALQRRTPAGAFETQRAATDWLVARAGELNECGILAKLETIRNARG